MEKKLVLWLICFVFMSVVLFSSTVGCQLYIELKKEKSEGWQLLQNKEFQAALVAFDKEIKLKPKNGYAKLGKIIALQNLGQLQKSREKLTALSQSPEVKNKLQLKADIEKILDRQTGLDMSKSEKNGEVHYLRALTLATGQLPVFTPDIVWGRKKIDPAEQQNIQNLITPYEPVFTELEKAVTKDYCYFTNCPVCGDQPLNYSKYQAVVKLWMLKGQLLAYEGKMTESAIIFKNVVRIGQQFEQGSLIQYLIGYSFRRFGMNGMNSLLAMPLKEPELLYIRDALTELERKDKPFDLMELKKSDVGGEQSDIDKFEPAIPRGKYPRTQLAIAKVAVAIKLYQLKENKLPNKLNELIPNYLPEIPKDVFGSKTLQGIKTPDGYTIYSFGPNKKDDSGKIAYDPTNGTFSSGDILLLIR